MISASLAVWASASRSAPALKPSSLSSRTNLKRSPSVAAMLLDRPPERGIGRVVDDEHAFEIRIVEPRDRIERELEHLRRLHVGRNVDRHFRRVAGRSGASGGEAIRRRGLRPKATAAISSMRASAISISGISRISAEREGEGRAGHEVVAVPVGEHDREPGADRMRGGGEQRRPGRRSRRRAPGSAATAARRSARRSR